MTFAAFPDVKDCKYQTSIQNIFNLKFYLSYMQTLTFKTEHIGYDRIMKRESDLFALACAKSCQGFTFRLALSITISPLIGRTIGLLLALCVMLPGVQDLQHCTIRYQDPS